MLEKRIEEGRITCVDILLAERLEDKDNDVVR